jgi:hypothetical protein
MPNDARIATFPDGFKIKYRVEGPTEDSVKEACDGIISAYHPAGYGTRFDVPVHLIVDGEDVWHAWGSRYHSCD